MKDKGKIHLQSNVFNNILLVLYLEQQIAGKEDIIATANWNETERRKGLTDSTKDELYLLVVFF